MNVKTRLATVVLAGILVGVLTMRLQRNSAPEEKSLVSFDDAVRRGALTRLQSMKDDAKSNVIGSLYRVQSLDPDPRVRVFALYALRKSGWAGPRVVGSLVRALQDKDDNVRKEATVGLMEIGTVGLEALIPLMQDPGVRGIAGDIVRTLPPESVAQLRAAMAKEAGQRRGATYIVSKLQRPETIAEAKTLLPPLSELLTSSDTILAANAAFAIHTLDPQDPRPAGVFLAALKRDNWDALDVRGWDALDALVNMPTVHSKVAAELQELLPKSDEGLLKNKRFRRPAIGAALAKVAPRDNSLSSRVADLKSKNAAVRWRAAYAISEDATVDPQYMAPLAGVLGDPDNAVAARAFYALDRMGMKNTERAAGTVYPKLIDTFERVGGSIAGFWTMASSALAAIGQPVAPVVLEAVKKGKLSPHKATSVFRSFSPDLAPKASLISAYGSDNAKVRLVGAMGLAKFAPETAGLAEELQKQLSTQQPPFSDEIQRTLDQLKAG